MPRGGKRSGTPGASYANRTDLNAAKPLAPTAAPGQPYGAAGAQLAAQQVVPMAPPATAPAAIAGPPGAPPAPAAPQPMGPAPGSLGDFGGPTARPNEPVTHGLAVGAGGGPEVLNRTPDPVVTGAAMLNSLSAVSPQIAALRNVVNATIANRAAP